MTDCAGLYSFWEFKKVDALLLDTLYRVCYNYTRRAYNWKVISMSKRIYGQAQYHSHRASNNKACDICGCVNELSSVQHADNRIVYRRGSNRVKIDCAYYFDIDKQVSWGASLEDVLGEIACLHAQGITAAWHDKRVCDKCYGSFALAINNRVEKARGR